MKKIILLLIAVYPLLLQAQVVKTLKKSIELKMPGKVYLTQGDGKEKKAGEDSLPGTRGGAVIWHPVQKKYYAAFAGNQTYPLAVFDITGKRLSDEDLTCMIDLRGLWYNPKLKKICGNGHYDIGWFSYTLDTKGIPLENEVYAAGMNQPGKQSIGVFNAKSNMVYFLEGQNIFVYNEEGMQEEDSTIRLYAGISKKEDIDEDDDAEYLSEDYSYNVLIYTGNPKTEFGLLNVTERQVELYNRKTGFMTQKLKLPADMATWPAFNFSYANGIFWAFDQDTRIWTGYK
jgi:hypothetical protein